MKPLLFFTLFLLSLHGQSQKLAYSTANAHSHNDYEKELPFWEAWKNSFGSIEADIFLHNGKLIVAHDSVQLQRQWTLDSLYLRPLEQCIRTNGGTVYKGGGGTLQFMIDIKSDSVATLRQLVERIQAYPLLVSDTTLQIVISGKRPAKETFTTYPAWIRFDGELQKEYSPEQWERIAMLSANFKHYSSWNGKGKMIAKENAVIKQMIANAHGRGKKIRFWNAPDNLNGWYAFMEDGVDFINTDRISEISSFFRLLPDRQFSNPAPHAVYQPRWRNDGLNKPAKNIILLIGDGTGLAQWYAAYTANNGALNVFNMRYTGLSKTGSFDSYITDSAPGATAFSSGVKTNNRAVGVDHTGNPLLLLPQIFSEENMKTGIITTGDVRDATPAAFYAHQPERGSFSAIFNDLFKASVQLLVGALPMNRTDSLKAKQSGWKFLASIDAIPPASGVPVIVADKRAALSAGTGRSDWALTAFQHSVSLLSKKGPGFFLVVEGAQVDHGGHTNRLPYVVSELLDFDKVVGKAMEFADADGETLVVVTGDHETGGLTLTGGDYNKGEVLGQFSTDDHTAVPVPVFAYGPGAHLFAGVYENTAIFRKILQARKKVTGSGNKSGKRPL